MIRGAVLFALALAMLPAQSPTAAPVRGLSGAAALGGAYNAILNAEFTALPTVLQRTCPPAAPPFCDVLKAVAVWWEIAIDPENRTHDARFVTTADAAIAVAESWTAREPQRAEAWFARGAAYGARAQWRVMRNHHLAAARDGKRIKEALERALALDPSLHDAKFGLGMYQYYAGVAPTPLRMFRWLLFEAGGNRAGALQQIIDARERGAVVRGEADFQLHRVYLWYEGRFRDGLAIVRDLQTRYPHNPLFYQTEAEILDVYFHDTAASVAVLKKVIGLAAAKQINEPTTAARRAQVLLAAIEARAKR